MKSIIAEFKLRHASDASKLAHRARVLAALTQLAPQRRNELAEAVNMVCRTIAAHGGRGTVRFALVNRGGQRAIEVSVHDLGDRSSQPESETPTGSESRTDPWEAAVMQRVGELVDHFESSGWPVAGAVIRMAQTLPPAFAFPSESEFADWAQMLQSNTALDALAYALRRARTLEKDLGDVRCQQHLRTELGSQLTESEHLTMLSLVISKTKNAISILRPDGTIIGVNDAFVQLTGYMVAEAINQRLFDLLFGAETDTSAIQTFRRALEEGMELTQDILEYRKDGETYWVESELIPVRNAEGQLTQWIVIDTDITRRRETEDALRAAKETAEKNSRLKSEFLANMSHEIRTPLNAIVGMTDLALATDLSDQQREYLQTVRSSGEALVTLLNDILDLSKIEAGRMELEEIDFDLHAVVQETVQTLRVKANEKGLSLTTELASDLPRSVRGDPTKLRQVLLNLVGNAIKFTQQGEVTVSAEPQWQSDDEMALHFAVRDTGIGIEREKLDEVFQAFRQSDASTTRQYGGSGLGLTISSELVRMMGGHIWVDSSPGQGSVFHFTIQVRRGTPLALPPVGAADAASSNLEGNRDNRDNWKSLPRVRPLQVLLADDHAANRQLVTSVLHSRGHHCTEVTNGQDAVDSWKRGTFDLLLMDVQMPVMDGFQATALIRKAEEGTGKHIPIVALTAHAMSGDRERCLAAGMDAYLAKPLRPQKLVTLVESVADLKPSTETAVPPANPPIDQQPIDQQPEFNLDYALETLDNDPDLLVGQMTFFLQDAPQLVATIAESISKNDTHQLQLAAHRLKGMLARYACQEGAALALALENEGRSNQIVEAETLLEKLRPLVSRLSAAIGHYVDERG